MKLIFYLVIAGSVLTQAYGQNMQGLSIGQSTAGMPINSGLPGNIQGTPPNSTFPGMPGSTPTYPKGPSGFPNYNSTGSTPMDKSTPGYPMQSGMPPNMTFPGMPGSTPSYPHHTGQSGFPQHNFTGGFPMGHSTPGYPMPSGIPPNMTFPGMPPNMTFPGMPGSTPSYPHHTGPSGFPQHNFTGGFPMGHSTPGYPMHSGMPPNMTFPGMPPNMTFPGMPGSTPSYPHHTGPSGFPQHNVTGGFPMGHSTPGYPMHSGIPPNMTFPGMPPNMTFPGMPGSTPSYPHHTGPSGFPQHNFTGGFPMGQSTPGYPMPSGMPPNMTFPGMPPNMTFPGMPGSTPSYPHHTGPSGFPQHNFTGGFPMGHSTPGYPMPSGMPPNMTFPGMPPNMTFPGMPGSTPSYPHHTGPSGFPQHNFTGAFPMGHSTPGYPMPSGMPPNMTFPGMPPNMTFPGMPGSTPSYPHHTGPSGFPQHNFTGGFPMGHSTPGYPMQSGMPPNMTFPGMPPNMTFPGMPGSTPSYPHHTGPSGFPQHNFTGGFPMGHSTPGYPMPSGMPPNMTFPGMPPNMTFPGMPGSTPSYPHHTGPSGFPQHNFTGGFPMGQSTPGYPMPSGMPPNMTFPGMPPNMTFPGMPGSTPSYPHHTGPSGFPQHNFTGGFPMGHSTPGYPMQSGMPPNMTFPGMPPNMTFPGMPGSTPSYPHHTGPSGFPQHNFTGGFPMGHSTPGYPMQSGMPPNMTFPGMPPNMTFPGMPGSTPSYPHHTGPSGFPQHNFTGGFPMGQSTPGYPMPSGMPPNMTFPGMPPNMTFPGMPGSTPSYPHHTGPSGFPQHNFTGGFPMGHSTPGYPMQSGMPPNMTFPGMPPNMTFPGMPGSTPSYPHHTGPSGFPQHNFTGGFPMGHSTPGYPMQSGMPPNMTFPGMPPNMTFPGMPGSTPSYPHHTGPSGFPQHNFTGGFPMGHSTPGYPMPSGMPPNMTFPGMPPNMTFPGMPGSTPSYPHYTGPSGLPQHNVTGGFPIGHSTPGFPINSGMPPNTTFPGPHVSTSLPGARTTAQFQLTSGQTRQPIISAAPFATTSSPLAYFPCEQACPICQSLTSKQGICMAYDSYGRIKQSYRFTLTVDQNDALTELENMTGVWQTKAHLRTCDGLTYHIDLYKNLARTTKDNMISFFDDVTSVTASQVAEFPKEMFAVLDPLKASQIYSGMTNDMKVVVCEDLKYYDCFTKEAISQNIDCAKALLESGSVLDTSDVLALLDVDNCTGWGIDNWNMTIRNFPDALDAGCMRVCPIDILMDNLRGLQTFCGIFDRRVVSAIANVTTEKIRQKQNNGQSTQREIDDWVKLLSDCGADPSLFNNVLNPKDTLKSADLSKVSAAEGMKFMEEALKSMNPADFSKDEIVNSINVLVNDIQTLKQMNDSELEAAACEVCSRADDMDTEDLIKFSDVIMGLPSFSNPALFDSTTFDCMGCMMAYMPTSSFDQIPDSSLQSALSAGNVKNMSITSKSMGKKVLENAKTAFNRPNGDFSGDELKKMGGALSAFTASEINSIPVASLTSDVIMAFDSAIASDSSSSRSLKAKIIEKVRGQSGGLSMLISTGLAAELPTSAIQDASISDFPGLTGDSGTSNIQCSRKQANFLMDLVKKELGTVSSTNANYTLKRLSNMQNYLSGLTPDDITNIGKDTTTCMDKLNTIAQASNMSREQTKTAYQQYKSCSNFDSTDTAALSSSTDSNSISQMAPMILAHHSSSELEKYGSGNCRAICERLAGIETKTLSKTEIKDKFNFCIKCMSKASSGDITTDDLDTIGNLVCGISVSVAGRLDTSSVDKYLPIVQYCSLDDSTRSTLASKAISSLNLNDMSTITASSAMTLGNLMSELSSNDLDLIDKSLLSSVTDKVAKAFESKEQTEKDRESSGFKLERTTTDKSSDTEKKKKVLKAAITAKLFVRSSSNTGRKKRSSGSLTCTDMQTLGTSGLSSVTESQISSLNDQEFIDCADLLGSVTDWTTTQKDALVVVAKRSTVWGDASTWTNTNVFSAGVMVQSLTTTEIDTLAINIDSVGRLGQFDGWSDGQKQSIFNNWLAAEKSSTVSSITSSELRSLGHISCGATTSQIGQITSTVYRDSADAVGEVTSCAEAQLYAWALLAKAQYGSDVTTWSSATVSNIGVVIGGLTQSEISTLSASQIDSIDANDISYIPASIFSGFTPSQILTFETAQAQATTASQRSALSSDQLSALSTAAGVDFSSSKAAGVTGSILLTVLAICVSYLSRGVDF